jgi:hypothetical protein
MESAPEAGLLKPIPKPYTSFPCLLTGFFRLSCYSWGISLANSGNDVRGRTPFSRMFSRSKP